MISRLRKNYILPCFEEQKIVGLPIHVDARPLEDDSIFRGISSLWSSSPWRLVYYGPGAAAGRVAAAGGLGTGFRAVQVQHAAQPPAHVYTLTAPPTLPWANAALLDTAAAEAAVGCGLRRTGIPGAPVPADGGLGARAPATRVPGAPVPADGGLGARAPATRVGLGVGALVGITRDYIAGPPAAYPCYQAGTGSRFPPSFPNLALAGNPNFDHRLKIADLASWYLTFIAPQDHVYPPPNS
jgi:hypothetical protein